MTSPSTDTDAAFRVTAGRLAALAPSLWRASSGRTGAQADLFFEDTVHHRLTHTATSGRARHSRPTRTTQRRRISGVGVRVWKGAAVGYGATEEVTEAALREALRMAAAQAGAGPVADGPQAAWTPPDPLPPDAPDAVGAPEKQALLEAAADAAMALDARVVRVEVAFYDRVRRVTVLTSQGATVATATSLMGLRVDVDLNDGRRRVRTYAVGGGTGGLGLFFDHPPEAVAREAVERAQVLAQARPGWAGPWTGPVVLGAGWGGVWLHEAVGHRFEADVRGCRDAGRRPRAAGRSRHHAIRRRRHPNPPDDADRRRTVRRLSHRSAHRRTTGPSAHRPRSPAGLPPPPAAPHDQPPPPARRRRSG